MSHDYRPDWDYPVQDLSDFERFSKSFQEQVQMVVRWVEEKLAPQMGFEEGLEVFFVAEGGLGADGARVGVFCSGTSSRPVLGIDLDLLRLNCLELGISFERQIAITLAHELGHAYQEKIGLEMHEADQGHEDEAETFARIWADTGVIRLDLFQPQDLLKDVQL